MAGQIQSDGSDSIGQYGGESEDDSEGEFKAEFKAIGKSPVIGSRRAGEPFELTALLTGERRQRRIQTATVPLPIGSATSERKELLRYWSRRFDLSGKNDLNYVEAISEWVFRGGTKLSFKL